MKYNKLFSLFVSILVLYTHSASGALDWFAYFTNDNESEVIIVDATTNDIEGTILTPRANRGIAITPDRSKAYLASSSFVNIINLMNNTVTSIPTGFSSTSHVAINPLGTKAYVTDFFDEILIIDIPTDTLIGSITLPSSFARDIAITPDGTKAYVSDAFTNDQVVVVDLVNNLAIGTIPVGDEPHEITITPDGLKAYVANRRSESISVISTATDTVINTIVFGASTEPTFYGIAITPDGTKAYATYTDPIDRANPGKVFIIDTLTDTFNPTPIDMGPFPRGIAITPDGLRAYVANGTDDTTETVTIIDLVANSVIGTLVGPQDRAYQLAITPDQAPIASFTANIAAAGTPSFFDASASTPSLLSPANITIARYDWNFGDGTLATSNSPTISHTYNTAGDYTVTLTITNSAGTSITKTFTGRTVSNNGGPSATTSQVFTVSFTPPSNLHACIVKNRCGCKHILSWKPSTSPNVAGYRFYQNGNLIETLSASESLVVTRPYRCCNKTYVYTVIAFDALGNESAPITITVRGCRCGCHR